MGKKISILISLTFMLGGLAAISPGTYAQTANDVVVTDPEGDVIFAAGGRIPVLQEDVGPEETPAGLPSELFGPVDITGFRVESETATTLSFEYSVADFSRPNSAQPQNVNHFLCFEYSPTGATYRFLLQFGFPTGVNAEVNSIARFERGILQRLPGDDCAIMETGPSAVESGASFGSFSHDFLPAEGKVKWTLPRSLLAELPVRTTGDDDPPLEPVPSAGDQLKNLRAYSLAWASTAIVAYDSTESADFTFSMDTGNEQVRVIIPSTVRAAAGVGGRDTPIYGVEIGSFQTVPVTIENDLPNPIKPAITVNILSGEASKWEIRALPSISVPAAVGDQPGRGTVTLIVNADPTVKHKDSVRLLVTALDEEYPHLGAQAVDVVAVAPPTAALRTLYFHGTGDPCQTTNRWINTLQQDAASGESIQFRTCDPTGSGGGTGTTGGEVGLVFRPDVPFARDYVLSTLDSASASIVLSSTAGGNGPSEDRVGVPMEAEITVQILSGSVVIGETTTVDSLGEDPKAINLNVEILPRMLGGFGREVPDDSGLRVRVVVAPIERTIEVGGCIQGVCTPINTNVDVPATGGQVHMNFGQSRIDLPIVSSERSGDLINITASGALMSLRVADGERHKVTNPGRIVVYNLTVQNEGVNVDTAQIDLVLNQTGWRAEILPRKEFPLEVGQPRSFNVKVTAPADGREGQSVRLDVYARSLVDPEASTRLPLTVEITTGQQFEDQEIDPRLQDTLEEDSPAPPVVLLLGILALLGVGLRRRR